MLWCSDVKTFLSLLALVVPFFLQCVGFMLAWPVVADVTVAAVCGPRQYSCTEALYLSGIVQGIVGVGTIFTAPYIGALSDKYGRRPLIIICFAASIPPFAILAWSNSRIAVYAYYSSRLLASLLDGPLTTVLLAYVGDVVPSEHRAAAMGFTLSAFSVGILVGTAASRLLPTRYTFQATLALLLAATAVAAQFLQETVAGEEAAQKGRRRFSAAADEEAPLMAPLLHCRHPQQQQQHGSKHDDVLDTDLAAEQQRHQPRLLSRRSSSSSAPTSATSLVDAFNELKNNRTLATLSAICFFYNFSDTGTLSVLLFYLKAVFHMDKDDFATLFFEIGAISLLSQILLLPAAVYLIGVHYTLVVGLAFCGLHSILYGLAWAPWVVYLAASMTMFTGFVFPAIGSIIAAESAPGEEGKLQGFVAGFRALAAALAPLIVTPISALFLSEHPPFDLPGAGQVFAGAFGVAAFVLALFLAKPGASSATVVARQEQQCHQPQEEEEEEEEQQEQVMKEEEEDDYDGEEVYHSIDAAALVGRCSHRPTGMADSNAQHHVCHLGPQQQKQQQRQQEQQPEPGSETILAQATIP